MGKKILIVASFLLILAFVGAIFLTQRTKRPETPKEIETENVQTAKLEIFSPHVLVKFPDSTGFKEAADGEEIPEGTQVKTDDKGRAQLVFPNKSVTRLDFNTEIVLKKLSLSPFRVEVKLEKKRIWSRVAKLLGQESYQTETSTTVATVRGTSYAHGILPDGRNRIISTKGVIESHCVNKSQEASVTPNSKILFDCTSGGKLPNLKLDAVVKDRDEWFTFNQNQDKALDERFGKDTYGDEDVLGTSAPAVSNLIDCKGPDGKIFKATKADCDNLTAFWASHSPAPEAQASPIPQSTPPPITISGLDITCPPTTRTCGGSVYGTGFVVGMIAEARDISGIYPSMTTETTSSSQIYVTFPSLQKGSYNIQVCFESRSYCAISSISFQVL